MLKYGPLLGISLVLCGCANAPRRQTSPPDLPSVDGLRFRVEIERTDGVVSEPFPIALHVAREERKAGKAASLLAGRFVFTFVDMEGRSGSAHARYHTFSGAGGVDYSGESPLEFEVLAPPVPGRYWFYVTVQSTPDDVRGFLILSRVRAGAGPWWLGNQSTRPVPVEIGPSRSAGPSDS